MNSSCKANMGLVWLTRSAAAGIAAPGTDLAYLLNLKLASPAQAAAFEAQQPNTLSWGIFTWQDIQSAISALIGIDELMPQQRISASFHHRSRRDNPSSDTARVAIKNISLNPTSRRSSHALADGTGPRGRRSAGHPARRHRYSAPTPA
jgi:hypothetical protein